MIPGARLVVLGRQGAGKGTQCLRLSRHYVVPHISTGDMLRAAVRAGTEMGMKAKAYMDRGELLPDDVMIGVVEERLARDDTANRGFILDGFPRTVAQAEALEKILIPRDIDVAVNIEVPTEVVLGRLSARRVCTDCGANYSTHAPPARDWTCDQCGGEVVQRADDTESAIRRRLEEYEEKTAPLVAWYLAKDQLITVDGEGPPDTVTNRIVRAVDARRQPKV